MNTCKDCICYPVCCKYDMYGDYAKECRHFCSNDKFVKLPCKVGDTVYYITGIHGTLVKPAIVREIILDENGVKDLFVSSDTSDFENSFEIFHVTKEEAERELNKRRKCSEN